MPSSSALSRIVIAKVALVCPARTVTVAGTVSAELSVVVRFTVTSLAAAAGSVTVPLAVPSFSFTLAGAVTTSGFATEANTSTSSNAKPSVGIV